MPTTGGGSANNARTATTGGAARTVTDDGAVSGRSAAAQQLSASAWLTLGAVPSRAGLRIGHIDMRSQHDMRASAVGAQPAHGRQTPAMMPSVRMTAATRRDRIATGDRMLPPPDSVN
jgi:hypothetical protein